MNEKGVVFLEGSEETDVDAEYRKLVEEATLVESALTLPRGYLSISQVRLYQNCPRAYWWRYIKDVISPPGVALVEGKAVHKGVEMGLRDRRELGKPGPLDVMLDAWNDAWKTGKKEVEHWGDKGETKESQTIEGRGSQLMTLFHKKHLSDVTPEEIEKRFWTTLGEQRIPVLGFIDLIEAGEEDLVVVDHKSAKAAISQATTDTDSQLTLYSLASETSHVKHNSFCKTKVPKICTTHSTRTQRDYDWLALLFDEVGKAISVGTFPPCDPSFWLCSTKYCGYHPQCRGKGVK